MSPGYALTPMMRLKWLLWGRLLPYLLRALTGCCTALHCTEKGFLVIPKWNNALATKPRTVIFVGPTMTLLV